MAAGTSSDDMFNNMDSEEVADFDNYDSDNDPEYVPETPSSKARRKLMWSPSTTTVIPETSSSDSNADKFYKESPIKPKKRQRNPEEWARNRASRLRNQGKEYVSRRGHLHRERKLQPYPHKCRYDCESVTERQKIFDKFWGLQNYDLQNSFINGCIKVMEPQRKTKSTDKHRNCSAVYYLQDRRVCKQFFIKTLDVSNGRLSRLVKKKELCPDGVSPRDKRGRKAPSNKIPQILVDNVLEHIDSFPKYVSHYSRQKNPRTKYLPIGLNPKKMYKLYAEKCQVTGTPAVKESYYRMLFNTKRNLSFHRPLTDTCTTCDMLEAKINNEQAEEASRKLAAQEKEIHLKRAQLAKDAKEADALSASKDPAILAFCFDLEKTLPTPLLTCSKVFYCRQLWTYNLCVHNLANDVADMFMWHEGIASRGCDEIASCILKFLERQPDSIKHIIAYSDNCGGQNKSHFIAKFWLYILKKYKNVEIIDHKFLTSGHSFMECDRDFGLIEKARKREKCIEVPDKWFEMVARTCRKFIVTEMTEFIDLKNLNKFHRDKVPGIQQMAWIRYTRQEPDVLYYKQSHSDMQPFIKLDMKPTAARKSRKSEAAENPDFDFKLKFTKGENAIKKAKFNDLQGLLEYIGPRYHSFYTSLKVQERTKKDKDEDEDGEDHDKCYDSC